METKPSTLTTEVKTEQNKSLSLQERVQKLIDNYTSLRERHAVLKDDYERALTSNIELEDTNTQLVSEKMYLEQKVSHLSEQLRTNLEELSSLREKNIELETLTHEAASKIDQILDQCEFD